MVRIPHTPFVCICVLTIQTCVHIYSSIQCQHAGPSRKITYTQHVAGRSTALQQTQLKGKCEG